MNHVYGSHIYIYMDRIYEPYMRHLWWHYLWAINIWAKCKSHTRVLEIWRFPPSILFFYYDHHSECFLRSFRILWSGNSNLYKTHVLKFGKLTWFKRSPPMPTRPALLGRGSRGAWRISQYEIIFETIPVVYVCQFKFWRLARPSIPGRLFCITKLVTRRCYSSHSLTPS